MNIVNKFLTKIKSNYHRRVAYRKLYSSEMLAKMPDSEKLALRSKYLKHLGFFSTLLVVSLLALLGAYLLDSPKEDFTKNITTYRKEQDFLAKKLDGIYGAGNWEYGVYQTNMDAFRVEVTLSDGSKVEHYYQVKGDNIYRLKLK